LGILAVEIITWLREDWMSNRHIYIHSFEKGIKFEF